VAQAKVTFRKRARLLARYIRVGGRSKQDSRINMFLRWRRKAEHVVDKLLRTFVERNRNAANHWPARHRRAKVFLSNITII